MGHPKHVTDCTTKCHEVPRMGQCRTMGFMGLAMYIGRQVSCLILVFNLFINLSFGFTQALLLIYYLSDTDTDSPFDPLTQSITVLPP